MTAKSLALVALLAMGTLRDVPTPVDLTVVGWTMTSVGGETFALVRVVVAGDHWTLKGDRPLDPGLYHGTLDLDVVRVEARDLKGKIHTVKYRVVSHAWIQAR